MALNGALGLGFIFTASDRASHVFRRVATNFRHLNKSADAQARQLKAATAASITGIAAMATGAKVAGAAMNQAMEAGRFEQQVQAVGQIAGVTGETLDDMRQLALAEGLRTPFSPHESIDGLRQMSQMGLVADQSMKALGTSLDLAVAGELTAGKAAETLGAALRVFSIDAADSTKTADKLINATFTSAIRAGDLALMLGTVGRGAGLAKQNLDEMLISMGLVKNTGVDASVAAQSVSSALIFMSKRADEFKALGVSITDANGRFRDFGDIVLDTHAAMAGITDEAERTAKAQELFSRFGVTAFTAISNQLTSGIKTKTGGILKGADALQYLREQSDKSGGSLRRMQDVLLNTLPGQVKILEGTLQTLGVVVGRPLAQTLQPMVTRVQKALQAIGEMFKGLAPETQQFIMKAITLGGVLVSVAGGALLLVGAIGLMKPMFVDLMGIVGGWKGILVFGGHMLALAAVVFVVKKAFEENFGGIATFVQHVFDRLRLIVNGIRYYFSHGFLPPELMKAENEKLASFVASVVSWLARAKAFFDGFVAGLKRGFYSLEPAFTMITFSFGVIWLLIKKVAEILTGRMIGSIDDSRKAGELFGEMLFKVGGLILLWRYRTIALIAAKILFAGLLVVAKGLIWAYRGAMLAGALAMFLYELWTGKATKATKLLTMWTVIHGAVMGGLKKVWAVTYGALMALRTAQALWNLQLIISTALTAPMVVAIAAVAAVVFGLGYAFGWLIRKLLEWMDWATPFDDWLESIFNKVTGALDAIKELDALFGGRVNHRGVGPDGVKITSEEAHRIALDAEGMHKGAVASSNKGPTGGGLLGALSSGSSIDAAAQLEGISQSQGLKKGDFEDMLKNLPKDELNQVINVDIAGEAMARLVAKQGKQMQNLAFAGDVSIDSLLIEE